MAFCNYGYTELGELKISTRTNRSSFGLSEPERVVLMFILDRTIGWHRVWQTISLSEFVNGVFRRKAGRRLVMGGGTGLTPEELNEALTHLQECGAIEIERAGRKVAYKINEYWCHPAFKGSGMWELNESDYRYNEEADDGKRSAARRARV